MMPVPTCFGLRMGTALGARRPGHDRCLHCDGRVGVAKGSNSLLGGVREIDIHRCGFRSIRACGHVFSICSVGLLRSTEAG